jgi:predicted acylesterase/phospholipase RssA
VRKNPGKTALVLAGGGLTGAVYEIGALRAIDDLLVDRSVTDFDIYVGTSAGALVSAFLANGIDPAEMFQVIDGSHPIAANLNRSQIFKLNWFDIAAWGVHLPIRLLGAWIESLREFNDLTLLDLLWSLSDALPSGLYDSQGLEKFVRQGFAQLGLSDQFSSLEKQLLITATDLVSGERKIFGSGYSKTPISTAVAASSAFPMIYKPMRIAGRDYIDGGTRGNASIDLAIEHGARLVVCINPLVPYDSQSRGEKNARLPNLKTFDQKGIQAIANQAFRIMLHSGLQYHIKQISRAHPEVDIILVEPNPEDYQMFAYNIMRFSARLMVAQYGFETVTLKMAQDYSEYKETLSRHHIPISRRLVVEEVEQIARSKGDPKVMRRILEAKTLASESKRRSKPIYHLSRSLDELEHAINRIQSG